MAKTILLTGAAGFIGYHTALFLLDRGDTVIGVDNFNDYYDVSLKEKRAEQLTAFKNFKILRADIAAAGTLTQTFEAYAFDTVVNFAAYAGVRYSLINPQAYVRSNITGFINILEYCRSYGVNHLVYASSSSVYGNNQELPFKEDHRCDSPIAIYGATKKSNEEMAYAYHHLYGIQCTGLRFFTVYGPWGRPDMALFLFARAIQEGREITVFNHGDMARDFTYVDDTRAGIVAAIDRPFDYEIFNLARGEVVPLMNYIAAVEKNMGRTAPKKMMPLQKGDIPVASADISKARTLLGYQPSIGFEEGVKRFVDWFAAYYG